MATKRQVNNDALLIETSVNVKNMSERLFGGPGQPDGGALHYIMTQHTELAKRLEENKTELIAKIESVKTSHGEEVAAVQKKQEDLDRKVNTVTTAGITVNAIAGIFLTWLGLRHHG